MSDQRERKRARLDTSPAPQRSTRTSPGITALPDAFQDGTRRDREACAHPSPTLLQRPDAFQRSCSETDSAPAATQQDTTTKPNLQQSLSAWEEPSQLVCFGMLGGIALVDEPWIDSQGVLDGPLPVSLPRRPGLMQLEDSSGSTIGQLDAYHSKLFWTLLTCETLFLQAYLVSDPHRTLSSKKVKSRGKGQLPIVTLSVVLYGFVHIFDDVGNFLSKSLQYLQSPLHCDRNVPYRNPQSLSGRDENPPNTFELSSWELGSEIETLPQAQDPATSLETEVAHPETEAANIIRTPLYSHQKQALSFMLALESDGSRFRGGILADSMGLGKTLSVISLIAHGYKQTPLTSFHRISTLLVVPSSLLYTWENELIKHVRLGTLSWRMYHGPKRNKDIPEILKCDIVLTTYSIIASEWKNLGDMQRPLFSTSWDRIVLDEAHDIRDSTTIRAKSVCALRGKYRWAVSGTPVQNRWEDLTSLLRFLRVYSDHDAMISKALLNAGETDTYMRNILSSICLRRSKKALSLPSRKDEIHKVDFDMDEAAAYNQAKDSVIRSLQWSTALDGIREYSNILARINALRQICNLGAHYQTEVLEDLISPDSSVQLIIDSMASTGAGSCSGCGNNLFMEHHDRRSMNDVQPQMSTCGLLICAFCVASVEVAPDGQRSVCQHQPTCEMWPVDEMKESVISPSCTKPLPVKMRALQKDMMDIPATEKRVVFSFWTSTLDLVAKALNEIGLSHARLDGAMPLNQRQRALSSFADDPQIGVLLISLRCGSTGLNLAVANHVFLMEPQWNPMLEDQALDRVHRIGQTREVTTIRYIVRDTLEESIRHQQTEKRNIAEEAFKYAQRRDHWIERVKCLLSKNA